MMDTALDQTTEPTAYLNLPFSTANMSFLTQLCGEHVPPGAFLLQCCHCALSPSQPVCAVLYELFGIVVYIENSELICEKLGAMVLLATLCR